MKLSIKFILGFGLITGITTGLPGCDGQKKSGELPAIIAAASYDAPTNIEARVAYLAGFEKRYNVPELNYPPEIVARVQAVRVQRLKNNKKMFKMNMKVVRTAVNSGKLGDLKGKDKEYADIVRGFGKDGEIDSEQFSALDEGVWNFIAGGGKKTKKLTPRELKMVARTYDQKVRAYKGKVGKYEVFECKWKKMQFLIGSGYEDMGIVHGVRPSHGYRCKTELTYKTAGRVTEGHGFFIKDQAGEWMYFGKYGGVGVKARRLRLNQMILDNPERALRKLSPWDLDI